MNPKNQRIKLLAPALSLAAVMVVAGCADTGDLITTGSTAATSALTTAEANENDFARARHFAESQSVALRRDAAAGEGENLRAFAALMREPDAPAFGQWMQRHYSQLYTDETPGAELVDRVLTLRTRSASIQRVAAES